MAIVCFMFLTLLKNTLKVLNTGLKINHKAGKLKHTEFQFFQFFFKISMLLIFINHSLLFYNKLQHHPAFTTRFIFYCIYSSTNKNIKVKKMNTHTFNEEILMHRVLSFLNLCCQISDDRLNVPTNVVLPTFERDLPPQVVDVIAGMNELLPLPLMNTSISQLFQGKVYLLYILKHFKPSQFFLT